MAKRHRNLIDSILDPDNFARAYHRASNGRRGSAGYLAFKEHDAAWLALLRKRISEKTYSPGKPREFWVYEPKPRPITALPFRDRIVQHALIAIIGPIFEAGMLPQSYGCRTGKGTHSGAIKAQSLIRQLSKTGRPVYALKTDFSKYFYSIDREYLWRLIRAKISCRHTLWLIERFTPITGRGIPIGNLTSQLWANVYGTAVDRLLAQTLRTSNFIRYMDDIVVLHNSRAVLETVLDFLECFCLNVLRLEFSHWSIQPVERGVNFLGYRIFKDHKLLRRDSVISAKRRIRKLTRARDQESLKRFLGAWLGHARWADSHNLIRHLARLKQEISNEQNHANPSRPILTASN